ncbi:MAG: hypothetical protein MI974_23600 [Chitinophagales bacterium]|nr:hypothetical protein [Chitinophagales bacterium]
MSKIGEVTKLLNSLSKSEKRYITLGINKLKLSNDAPADAVGLFSKLSNSELLKILEKGNPKSHLTFDQFVKEWATKNIDKKLLKTINIIKLLQILMDLLRQYYSEQGEFKLEKIIQEIRIYRDKALYTEALRMIEKAKEEIIEKHGNHFKAQEVLLLERKLWRELRSSESEEKIEILQKENIKQANHAAQFLNAITEQENLIYLSQKKNRDSYEDFELSTESQEVLKNINNLKQYSFHTQLYLLHNLILYHQHILKTKTFEQIHNLRRHLYYLFKNSEEKQRIYPKEHKITLILYLNGFLLNKRLSEAASLIKDAENILEFKWENGHLSEIGRIRTEIDFNILSPILYYYLQAKQFILLREIMDLADPYLQNPKIRTQNRYMLFYNASFISIVLNDQSKTANYLTSIRKLEGVSTRDDYFIIDIIEILYMFPLRNEKIKSSELEALIGDVIIQISKGAPEADSNIARDILQTLYSILNEERDPFSSRPSKSIEIEAFEILQKNLLPEKVERTLFQYFPIWLEKTLEDLKK